MPPVTSIFDKIATTLGSLVTGYPVIIAVVFILAAGGLLVPLSDLEMQTDMSDFFPENRFRETDWEIRDEFNASSTIVSVAEAGNRDILDRDGLLALLSLGDSIRSHPDLQPYLITHVSPVVSIATVIQQMLTASGNGTLDIENAPEAVLEHTISMAMSDSRFAPLVSDELEGRRPYALILVKVDYALYQDALEHADESIELAVQEALDRVDLQEGYEASTLGGWNSEIKNATISSMSVLMPVTVLVLIIILLVSLRSLIDLFISLFGLLVTIVITFGLFSLLGLSFNQLTFLAPIMILVLSIDFAIHILLRFKEQEGKFSSDGKGMAFALKFIGISIVLSAMTTIIAFASNAVSEIPAIKALGLVLAIGITASFLVMMLFVPSLKLLSRRLFKGGAPRSIREGSPDNGTKMNGSGAGKLQAIVNRGIVGMGRGAYRHPAVIVAIALVITVGGFALATQLEKEVSRREMMPEGAQKIQILDVIQGEFSMMGAEQVSVVVSGQVSDPEFLKALDSSIRAMADDDHVVLANNTPQVQSVLGYIRMARGVPTMAANMTDTDNDGIPDTRDQVEGVLKVLITQGIPGKVLPRDVQAVLSPGNDGISYDMVRLIVDVNSVEGAQIREMYDQLVEDMSAMEDLEKTSVSYAGSAFERDVMLKAMTDGMFTSTLISLLVCCLVVIVLFWSLRYGLIAVVPVIVVLGASLGATVLLGFTLNPITATTAAMTIGVGIDYAIHLIERYRQEREKGGGPEAAMDTAMEHTGIALLAAGSTTGAGFAIISFSPIGMFHAFGTLAFLIVVLVLFSSLVVLPALLVGIDRKFSDEGKQMT